MNTAKLKDIVNDFPKQKVLVLGDIMVDEYLECRVERKSPEDPSVNVARVLTEKKRYELGGAANVARNLNSLGIHACLIAVRGKGENGKKLEKLLKQEKVMKSGQIFIDKTRPTTLKTRIMDDKKQLLRIDREETHPVSQEIEKKIISAVKDNTKKLNIKVIIISDYNKGVVTDKVAQEVIAFANKNGIKVLVDPTPQVFAKYSDCYLLKPNKKEAEQIAGNKIDLRNAEDISRELQKQFNSNLVITLGADGLIVFGKHGYLHLQGHEVEVSDVIGAGDSSIAGMAAGLASGAGLVEAAVIGNICSAVVVSKKGTSVCEREELLAYLDKYEKGSISR